MIFDLKLANERIQHLERRERELLFDVKNNRQSYEMRIQQLERSAEKDKQTFNRQRDMIVKLEGKIKGLEEDEKSAEIALTQCSQEVMDLQSQKAKLVEALKKVEGGLMWAITHLGLVPDNGIFEDLKRVHNSVKKPSLKSEVKMSDDIEVFNCQCAKALEWEMHKVLDNNWYSLPKGLIIDFNAGHAFKAQPKDMHFHDSYDWAMLLVKKCNDMAMKVHIKTSRYIDFSNEVVECYEVSVLNSDFDTIVCLETCDFNEFPLKISQCCLKAFENILKKHTMTDE